MQMKRFGTYEEFVEITKEYRKSCDYKNVFFLKNQVQDFIKEEKLSYTEKGRNLYIFEKCEGFSRFYFYISKDEPAEPLQYEETLVIEFVYNAPAGEKQENTVEYLNRLGFTLGRRSMRMTLQSLADFKYNNERGCDNDVEIGLAEDGDAEQIRRMLLAEFDPLYAFIPSCSELRQIIEEGRIVVARCGGEIAGFEHFEITKKVLKCWHMLVAEPYQGKGIGWRLFSESHRLAADKAASGQIWLRSDNTPAINMYRSGGYESDNRFSDEYVLR